MTSARGVMVVVGGLAGLLLVISLFSGWQGASRLRGQGEAMSAIEDAALKLAFEKIQSSASAS